MGIGSAAPCTSDVTTSHTKWSECCSSGEEPRGICRSGGWVAPRPSWRCGEEKHVLSSSWVALLLAQALHRLNHSSCCATCVLCTVTGRFGISGHQETANTRTSNRILTCTAHLCSAVFKLVFGRQEKMASFGFTWSKIKIFHTGMSRFVVTTVRETAQHVYIWFVCELIWRRGQLLRPYGGSDR